MGISLKVFLKIFVSKSTPSRSLAGIAGIVAAATLISKVFGLVRTQAIAAVFGVGVVADAFNYAYVIPGFLLVLLGGINGPFHSAIVSVLAKRPKSEAAPLVETVTTFVGGLLLLVTIALIFFAPGIIDLVAPGLGTTPHGLEVKAIAIGQMRIMAPMALLAGLIGIGFGTLNAANLYWLPSVSPLFSSITVIIGLGVLAWQLGAKVTTPQYAMLGGAVLAWGTLAGAVLQWLIQVPAQWKSGMGTLRLRFDFNQPGVKEVTKIMAPATFSSGMSHINLYVILILASYIPQAASALQYAGLLIQTPLGILSNVILVPMLPIFSRLADPQDWDELKGRIRQGLLLTAITMLPLGAITIALAVPIVRVVYERGAFDRNASQLVSSLLVMYGIGMFVYLGRDVLVRVFYALGDGNTPFRISMVSIFFNIIFAYVFFKMLGAPGLVLATVVVNIISMLLLFWMLDRKLHGLPWLEWSLPILALTGSSFLAGLASWGSLWGIQQFWHDDGFKEQLVQLTLAGGVGIGVFALIAMQMKLPEVDVFMSRIRQKLGR